MVALEWRPTERQTTFLRSNAFEGLFGGAAGGGKSEALMYGAMRWVHEPTFRALMLRRTSPELVLSVWARSYKLMPYFGGVPNVQNKLWRFPSGAVFTFGHLEHEWSVQRYQSAEFQYVAFDELTHFTKGQYLYMISRMRSTAGIPLRLRAGTNPGGDGHEWVLERFAPWLYRKGHRTDEYSGPYVDGATKLWFLRDPVEDTEVEVDPAMWLDCETCGAEWQARGPVPDEVDDDCAHLVALSRTFVPSRVEDNPHLGRDYRAGLQQLDPLTHRQLRRGDWMARPESGMFFKRAWWVVVDEPPPYSTLVAIVRFWDRAATSEEKGKDPDWTAGVLMARDVHGLFWVLDVVRFRGEPHEVEDRIANVAELDAKNQREDGTALAHGTDSLRGKQRTSFEQEPGASGKVEVFHLSIRLAAFDIDAERPTGDKITRAKPWSAACKMGIVRLVKGRWNAPFQREHEAFPKGAGSMSKAAKKAGKKDDQVDGASGAYNKLLVLAPRERKAGAPRETAEHGGGY